MLHGAEMSRDSVQTRKDGKKRKEKVPLLDEKMETMDLNQNLWNL